MQCVTLLRKINIQLGLSFQPICTMLVFNERALMINIYRWQKYYISFSMWSKNFGCYVSINKYFLLHLAETFELVLDLEAEFSLRYHGRHYFTALGVGYTIRREKSLRRGKLAPPSDDSNDAFCRFFAVALIRTRFNFSWRGIVVQCHGVSLDQRAQTGDED